MTARRDAAGLATIGILAVAGCLPQPEPVAIAAEHDGLELAASISNTGSSIAIDVLVRNRRTDPVALVPDQCGRVVDVELERTRFLPEGQRWEGSIQAVKDLLLEDQHFLDRPDSFAPRRVGDSSSATPDCARPMLPVVLAPGDAIAERWELPLETSFALKALGSDATLVSLETVEARDPNEPEFLNVMAFDAEDPERERRTVRAELPAGQIVDRDASEPVTGPTYGELFDRLAEHDDFRTWLEAHPPDVWREANLWPGSRGATGGRERLELRVVSAAHERAAVVTAAPDGSHAVVELPGEEDRTREFARTPGTLPPGIEALPDADFSLTDDLHLGEVMLPSGRLVVGEFLLDEEPLPIAVASGAYPAHATLARYADQAFDRVALATLVLSDAPTVRWEEDRFIAVDGGSTTITSVEGRDALSTLFNDDENAWMDLNQQVFESAVAHDYLATEYTLTPDTNLAYFSSGIGDGRYPVYVGYDASGAPTRVVVDFYLVHLGWPGAR